MRQLHHVARAPAPLECNANDIVRLLVRRTDGDAENRRAALRRHREVGEHLLTSGHRSRPTGQAGPIEIRRSVILGREVDPAAVRRPRDVADVAVELSGNLLGARAVGVHDVEIRGVIAVPHLRVPAIRDSTAVRRYGRT